MARNQEVVIGECELLMSFWIRKPPILVEKSSVLFWTQSLRRSSQSSLANWPEGAQAESRTCDEGQALQTASRSYGASGGSPDR